MQLPDDAHDAVTDPAVRLVEHPCAVCGAEAWWEVWGARLCPEDCRALMEAEPYTPKGFDCSEEDFPRVAVARTEAWVKQARAQLSNPQSRSAP